MALLDEPPFPDFEKYIVYPKNNIHGYSINNVILLKSIFFPKVLKVK